MCNLQVAVGCQTVSPCMERCWWEQDWKELELLVWRRSGLGVLCQRATQLSALTSWVHCRCKIRLYSSGLAWEEPVLDRWSSRASAGHSPGGYLARDTRVHCGDGWRPGPAPLPGAPAFGRVRLGQEDMGTSLPSLPYFPPRSQARSWGRVGITPPGCC